MLLRNIIREDINSGIKKWKATRGAVLLDVRSKEEYACRHIEGSVNVPLDTLVNINSVITDKNIPLFVLCRSGVRSARAASYLNGNGYRNVYDIGGISSYRGRTRSYGGELCLI